MVDASPLKAITGALADNNTSDKTQQRTQKIHTETRHNYPTIPPQYKGQRLQADLVKAVPKNGHGFESEQLH